MSTAEADALADYKVPKRQTSDSSDLQNSEETDDVRSLPEANRPSLRRTSSCSQHSQNMFAEFIRAESQEGDTKFHDQPMRRMLYMALESSTVKLLVGLATGASFWGVIVDTDARAAGDPLPSWLVALEYVLFSVFFLELSVRFYVERWDSLNNLYTVADIVVVCTSVAEYILIVCGVEVGLSKVRALRLVRMMKLVRVVYRVPFFVELRKLMYMISCCMKTLFWSFLVLGVVMTIWSIIAVELIHPRVLEMSLEGTWPDCERCGRAFSSVFHSNITFFQTIVAGDSWGLMAIPVIEAHPWSAVLFVGTLLTLVFGVLNVIVAVVVDAFAEARAKDVFTRARELQWEEEEEKTKLSSMFEKMDKDGNGSLDIEELKDGAKKVPGFSHWLRVLDIDARDLEDMFIMLDRDGSGDIDKNEFVEWMYRMKNTDSKTVAQFVKQKLMSMEEKVQLQDDDRESKLSEVSQLLTESVRKSDLLYRGIEEGLAEVRKQVMDSLGAALSLCDPLPKAEPSVPPSRIGASFLLRDGGGELTPSCHRSLAAPSLDGDGAQARRRREKPVTWSPGAPTTMEGVALERNQWNAGNYRSAMVHRSAMVQAPSRRNPAKS